MALTHCFITTQPSAKQHMPRPESIQAASICAEQLAGTSRSRQASLREVFEGNSDAFSSLWFESKQNLSTENLFIDSSAYINRLQPTPYPSGERRRLAATPS